MRPSEARASGVRVKPARWAVLAASAVAASTCGQVTIYDLADDWSVASNPNGPWSYNRAIDDPHPSVILDYYSNGTMQPAWAAEPWPSFGHISVFMKHVEYAGIDPILIGRVAMHPNDPANSPTGYANAAANFGWVCPAAGTVAVEGGLWLYSPELGRTTDWSLTLNGVPFTGGLLGPADPHDADSPMPLTSGWGGAPALQGIAVEAGDVIRFVMTRAAGNPFGTSTGLDFTIRLDLGAGCNPADLASPFGVLDLADVTGFVEAFVARQPPADVNDDGLYDLADVNLFVAAFVAGCP
jgi:hypothetical protein